MRFVLPDVVVLLSFILCAAGFAAPVQLEKDASGNWTLLADGKPFAFSALPYTAQELENAAHQDELPPVSRTVLTVMGAVRGVGGIDSWGTDVEPAYHISGEEDHSVAFLIEL